MTAAAGPDRVGAAGAAWMLGITRRQLLALATKEPGFPAAEPADPADPAVAGRRWTRAQILAWAAAHPDHGHAPTALALPPIGRRPPQVARVAALSAEQARALRQPWVGEDHLLLALARPGCPGAAPGVLASLGVAFEPLRAAFTASFGDPYERPVRGVSWAPAAQFRLERAPAEAILLADAEVASEHVLLALTGDWDASLLGGRLAEAGVDAASVRRRVVELTEAEAAGDPLPQAPPTVALPEEVPDPAARLDLAPTPDRRDPRRRRPWGSMVFLDPDGQPVRHGSSLRQYYIDRDDHPVLTRDGRPIHRLLDRDGRPLRDDHGRPRIGPVDVPAGSHIAPDPDPA